MNRLIMASFVLNSSRILLLVSLTCVLVLGCGGSKKGLSANVGHSGFDNARTVDIPPHVNAMTGTPIRTGLGAQWNASRPDSVLLIVAMWNQYMVITDAQLNIDGEKISLTRLSDSVTDIDRNDVGRPTSTRAFATDIATVKKIIASKRTWLRVNTPTGYIDDAVIDGGKDSKAYHALIRFIAAVEAK
jgi:hypothetical protein